VGYNGWSSYGYIEALFYGSSGYFKIGGATSGTYFQSSPSGNICLAPFRVYDSGGTYRFQVDASGRVIQSTGIGALVRRSNAQSIANNTSTAVSFDTVVTDSYSMFSSSYPTRLRAPVAGLYAIATTITWQANSSGGRYIHIRVNGSTVISRSVSSSVSSSNEEGQVAFVIYYLNANDYVEIIVYQNSGAALNLNAVNYTPQFAMWRIA
jgi:hypothetical protein